MRIAPSRPAGAASPGKRHLGRSLGAARWASVLCVAIGAAVIGAALAAHYLWVRPPREPPPPRARGVVWQWPAATAPTTAPASPLALTTQALEGVDLCRLAELPADLALPPGAVRSYAFRRALPDGVMDNLVGVADATVQDAAEFYRTTLRRCGYTLVTHRPAKRPGGMEMLFLKGSKDYCRVGLRPADKGKKVRIALVISRSGR